MKYDCYGAWKWHNWVDGVCTGCGAKQCTVIKKSGKRCLVPSPDGTICNNHKYQQRKGDR